MNFKNPFKKKGQGGKGFAAAVGLCLLVIAGAGVYSYSKISDKLNSSLISGSSGTSDTSEDAGAQANAKQTQIPKAETMPSETAAPVKAAGSEAVTETEPAEKADVPVTGIEFEMPAAAKAMVRPLNGEVLVDFSDGELVKSATLNVWKTHDGVDIAGNRGEKVKSMTSGMVTDVYDDQLMGISVVIDHGNGLTGYYCNLDSDVPVSKGQSVSAGTVIGTLGDTAESEIKEGTHLHFALKKNGEWTDPISLISGEGS